MFPKIFMDRVNYMRLLKYHFLVFWVFYGIAYDKFPGFVWLKVKIPSHFTTYIIEASTGKLGWFDSDLVILTDRQLVVESYADPVPPVISYRN